MRTFHSIIVSVVATLALSGTAYAADLAPQSVEPTAPIAPKFNWSGLYAGVQAGYAWGSSSYFAPSNGFHVTPDPDGGFGGIYAGCNYQFPSNLVLGAEADIAGGDINGSVNTTGQQHYTTKEDVFGSARIRLGYALDRFLPFVTGGVAVANYKHDAQAPLPGHTSWSDTYTGWTIGAGLEYALTDNITTRIEYRYSDFGSESYPATPAANNRRWRAHTLDLKTNDVSLGIAYKF